MAARGVVDWLRQQALLGGGGGGGGRGWEVAGFDSWYVSFVTLF